MARRRRATRRATTTNGWWLVGAAFLLVGVVVQFAQQHPVAASLIAVTMVGARATDLR